MQDKEYLLNQLQAQQLSAVNNPQGNEVKDNPIESIDPKENI